MIHSNVTPKFIFVQVKMTREDFGTLRGMFCNFMFSGFPEFPKSDLSLELGRLQLKLSRELWEILFH